MDFKKKYGILLHALMITLGIVLIKGLIDHNNYSFIPVNALTTAFMGGVFFTIGILMGGAAVDFKEAEKLPAELAVALRTFINDTKVISMQQKDRQIIDQMQTSIKQMLYTINSNLRKNKWRLNQIDQISGSINQKITLLAEKGIPPNFIIKLRSEMGTIDRLCHRIYTIKETTFIPAAYSIAELSVGSLLLLLLFTKIDFPYGGVILTGIISIVLISLILLIRDMDDPFETNAYADVDITILFKLEKNWKEMASRETPAVQQQPQTLRIQ